MKKLALFVVSLSTLLSATTSAVSAPSPGPLVGTWSRTTTCAELVAVLRKAGMTKMVPEMVAGNGFVPNARNPGQLDPANTCRGAAPRKHSHFFRRDGQFGSLDWNGDRVDDGRWRITKPGVVTISKEFPDVSFRYVIRGNVVSLTPLVPKGCATFRCAWAMSVAYPGRTWKRQSG